MSINAKVLVLLLRERNTSNSHSNSCGAKGMSDMRESGLKAEFGIQVSEVRAVHYSFLPLPAVCADLI